MATSPRELNSTRTTGELADQLRRLAYSVAQLGGGVTEDPKRFTLARLQITTKLWELSLDLDRAGRPGERP